MDGGTTVLLGAACALACAVGTYYWRGRSAADQEEGGAGAAASTENALSGGGAAAQRMFESVGAMEAWLAEGGWSCLLVVGNNSRGYSEASFSVRERPQPASLAAPAERRRALRRRRRPACALYSTTRRRTARWVRRSASRAPCRARALIGSRGVRAGRARSAKRLLVVFGGDGVNPGAPPLSRRARLDRPLPPRAPRVLRRDEEHRIGRAVAADGAAAAAAGGHVRSRGEGVGRRGPARRLRTALPAPRTPAPSRSAQSSAASDSSSLHAQAVYYPEEKDGAGETLWCLPAPPLPVPPRCFSPSPCLPARGCSARGGVGAEGGLVGGSRYYLDGAVGGALCGVVSVSGGDVSAVSPSLPSPSTAGS